MPSKRKVGSTKGTVHAYGMSKKRKLAPGTAAGKGSPKKGKVANSDNHYVVSHFLAYRQLPLGTVELRIARDVYFLVKWEGYDFADSTWESVFNLTNSVKDIRQFLAKTGKKLLLDSKTQEAWVTGSSTTEQNQAVDGDDAGEEEEPQLLPDNDESGEEDATTSEYDLTKENMNHGSGTVQDDEMD